MIQMAGALPSNASDCSVSRLDSGWLVVLVFDEERHLGRAEDFWCQRVRQSVLSMLYVLYVGCTPTVKLPAKFSCWLSLFKPTSMIDAQSNRRNTQALVGPTLSFRRPQLHGSVVLARPLCTPAVSLYQTEIRSGCCVLFDARIRRVHSLCL